MSGAGHLADDVTDNLADIGFPVRMPVLALVTSAGGLNALSAVLAPLPARLPAAVVVVQHLDPEQPSVLATLLASRTPYRCGLPATETLCARAWCW